MRFLLCAIDRLLAPSPQPARVGWLATTDYAHRGDHGAGRVENSLSAFRVAIARGLGIEFDIQRSRDGVPMVFHDWDLSRLLGRPETTDALDAAELAALNFGDSGEGPISLATLLAEVAGRVPLLVEIKSRPGYDVERSCEAVHAALAGYGGALAVMSFDPRVARWFRRNSPGTVRGLVVREDAKGHTQQAWQRHLALWIARPDFIAYHVAALPSPFVADLRARGMPVVTWTVDTPGKLAIARVHADAALAEGAGLA